MEQGWIVRVPWGIVPGGEPLQRGGWSRAVNENTGWVLRRNFWKEVRKCEKIHFNQELIEEKTKCKIPTLPTMQASPNCCN